MYPEKGLGNVIGALSGWLSSLFALVIHVVLFPLSFIDALFTPDPPVG